jgi:hypothetical protein
MNDTLNDDDEVDTEQINIEGLGEETPFIMLEKPQDEQ